MNKICKIPAHVRGTKDLVCKTAVNPMEKSKAQSRGVGISARGFVTGAMGPGCLSLNPGFAARSLRGVSVSCVGKALHSARHTVNAQEKFTLLL